MTDTTTQKTSTPTVQICPKQITNLNKHLGNIENYLSTIATLYNKAVNVVYIDYESITVTSSAIGLTYNKRISYDKAFITCETAQLRYRLDGIMPTASEGHLMNIGDSMTLENKDQMVLFNAIAVSTSGTLKVSYANGEQQVAGSRMAERSDS